MVIASWYLVTLPSTCIKALIIAVPVQYSFLGFSEDTSCSIHIEECFISKLCGCSMLAGRASNEHPGFMCPRCVVWVLVVLLWC